MLRILIIDDDPMESELIRSYMLRLAEGAYEVLNANSVGAAIGMLKNADADCILLDNRLYPHNDCRPALSELLGAGVSKEKITLFSSSPDDPNLVDIAVEGGYEVVNKSEIFAWLENRFYIRSGV